MPMNGDRVILVGSENAEDREDNNIVGEINTERTFCSNILIFCTLTENLSYSSIEVDSVTCQTSDLVNGPNILAIITYTGVAVSTVGLVFSIYTSRKCALSNSIVGSNLESLSVSLIVAGILFMFGIGANRDQTACVVMGIVLHYLWLSVFCFMSLGVIYLVYDISHMRAQPINSRDSVCKIFVFRVIGLCLPMLLVVPAVMLEFISSNEFSPNYGGSICFPTKYPAVVIFVAGPITFSVALNLISLITLVVYLAKHEQEATKIRHRNLRQQAEIYLRLSVVTGVFWITGIFGSIFQSEILNYMFVIICSFQGFLIAVANVTTKRARQYWQGTIRRQQVTSINGT